MKLVFLIAACCSVLAVALICIFLFMNGVPAIFLSLIHISEPTRH